jgi:hypothetical protein
MFPISKRKSDWYYVYFFVINLVVAVSIYDTTMIFVPKSCSVGVPNDCDPTTTWWPPTVLARAFHQHMYDNDPLGYARPTWFMVTIWMGLLLWGPFYIVAIFAFIRGDNRIRIPCIMYCTAMIVILTMITAENLIGPHKRADVYSFFQENALWLVTIPALLIKMLKSDTPFNNSSVLKNHSKDI